MIGPSKRPTLIALYPSQDDTWGREGRLEEPLQILLEEGYL